MSDDLNEQKMRFMFALRSKGVTDTRVLTAMENIDRGPFVRGIFTERAYEDMPLPIACGQTISQPSAIGLSQFYGPDNALLDNPFEAAAQHGVEVIRKILDTNADSSNPYNLFFNVNFPPVPADAVAGTRVVPQGRRAGTNFGVELQERPNRRKYLWVTGGDQRAPSNPGTDVAVNLEGYISVTPMRADLTAHDMLDTFRGIE